MEILTKLLGDKLVRQSKLETTPSKGRKAGGSGARSSTAGPSDEAAHKPSCGSILSGLAPPTASLRHSHKSSASKSVPPGSCWLCDVDDRRLFPLTRDLSLCLSCFRLSFRALLLPMFFTESRNAHDDALVRHIIQLDGAVRRQSAEGAASAGKASQVKTHAEHVRQRHPSVDGTDAHEAGEDLPTVEVTKPSQASFINHKRSAQNLSSTLRNTRNSKHHGTPIASTTSCRPLGLSGAPADPSTWACPLCTFLNAKPASVCGACGYVVLVGDSMVTCCYCGCRCRVFPGVSSVASICSREQVPHCVWRCKSCQQLETVDLDACSRCKKAHRWNCTQCSLEQFTKRTSDGLRQCTACQALNVPYDVCMPSLVYPPVHAIADDLARRRCSDPSVSDVALLGISEADTRAEVALVAEMKSAEERLSERVRLLGVHVHQQDSDGNCQFRAISHQLLGNSYYHLLIRHLVVCFMAEHSEEYSLLFDGQEEWQSYLSLMNSNGYWGDELTLNAAARCFCVNIHVITSDATRWHLVFQHDKLSQNSRDPPEEVGAAHSASPSMSDMAARSPGTSEKQQLLLQQPSLKRSPSVSKIPMTQQQDARVFLIYTAPVHYCDIGETVANPPRIGELLKSHLLSLKGTEDRDTEALAPKPAQEATAPHGDRPSRNSVRLTGSNEGFHLQAPQANGGLANSVRHSRKESESRS